MARIALVTGADGELGPEGRGLLAALADEGVDAEPTPWTSARDWSAYDAAVVRSTWDYTARRDDFVDWVRSTARVTRLANPPDVIEWNTDKRYLRGLAGAGVPVVDTVWAEDLSDLPAVPAGWAEVVVKPAVSAAAMGAARHPSGDTDGIAAHVRAILASGRAAMLQPYVPEVDVAGEVGTFVLGGEVTHAIRKYGVLDVGAAPTDTPELAISQRCEEAPVTPELEAFARGVTAAIPFDADVLYARVDAVATDDGLKLLELELVEPYLFSDDVPSAAAAYARAVRRWLHG